MNVNIHKTNDLRGQILNYSDQGKYFFEYMLYTKYGINLKPKGTKAFHPICLPFYNDTNPSCSIYQGDDYRWRFYDHGNSEFRGDVFSFAAYCYNLDYKRDFPEILRRMASDLQIMN